MTNGFGAEPCYCRDRLPSGECPTLLEMRLAQTKEGRAKLHEAYRAELSWREKNPQKREGA